MKNYLLFLLLSVFVLTQVSGQSMDGSLSPEENRLSETTKLASLCKLYGYLKYYNPNVAKGKFSWDEHLLEKIPEVLNASNKNSLCQLYLDWIASLGEVPICKKCKTKGEYFDKNFDLFWTQDSSIFSSELRSELKYIEENRNQEENHYVSQEPVGTIKTTNETAYENLDFPTEEYRLLGLFKYWNTIE